MSTQVFLAPVCGHQSREHFEKTVRNSCALDDIRHCLSNEELSALASHEELYVWGNREGTKSSWERMNPGDWVLFYQPGRFTYAGKIHYKTRNKALAESLWESAEGGEAWEYVFFLENFRKIDIDAKVIQELGGYVTAKVQNFRPLNKIGVDSIVQKFGSVENFLETNGEGFTREAQEGGVNYWIEKTMVSGRLDREEGEYALGRALWSPQRDRRGADIYSNMRRVKSGDIILHLVDNSAIVGISRAASECDSNFKCLQGTDWDDGTGNVPGYLIRLTSYVAFENPVGRHDLLSETNRPYLEEILNEHRGVFYNRRLELNQGSYLTRAPEKLVALINDLYMRRNNGNLPYVDEEKMPPKKPRYWQIAPGEQASMWPRMRDEGHIAVGWGGTPDLSSIQSKDALFQVLKRAGIGSTLHDTQTQKLWNFLKEVSIGDKIIANKGRSVIVGVGEVIGDYYFDESQNEYKHCKKVRWDWTGEKEVPMQGKFGTTIVELSKEEFEALSPLFAKSAPPGPERITFTVDDAISDIFMDREDFENILGLFRTKKNIILQGPPGVGKTFFAKRLADALVREKGSDRVSMVQFHQSYCYEDFMQGYRPTEDGKFALKDGLFYEFCMRAANDPENDYVFIVDEINRGNLSKIFGEVMMLIEADKRGEEWAISLTYAEGIDLKFYIPENLYLLGLMNTADRSLAMVDYALRRRFRFKDLKPQFEHSKFRDHLKSLGVSDDLLNHIRNRIGDLNQKITDEKDLGDGFCVGHSFFCPNGPVESGEQWYNTVIEYEIAPLIREYWFDKPKEELQEEIDRLLV